MRLAAWWREAQRDLAGPGRTIALLDLTTAALIYAGLLTFAGFVIYRLV